LTTTLQLATPRLLLRPFEDRDRAPFGAMNANPVVMRYFPNLMTRKESDEADEAIDRYNLQLARDGFTMFALEDRTTAELVGILGAQTMRFEATVRDVVAITTPDNLASQNVMRKLGMLPRPELTFDHPLIAADHPRRQHVLYSLELNLCA